VGFGELKKRGVEIIVNLRHERDEIGRERALVQSQGMQYVSIPWRGSNDPDTGQIVEFPDLLRANPSKQVFVHCQRGAERTGVMIACYRMSGERWREFPSVLLSNPLLKQSGIGTEPSSRTSQRLSPSE
jgi:tyrosine-protein phosphatase SIW14